MNRPNLTDRVAPRAARDLALVFCFVLLPSLADCHGLMTIPRQRGCLNTQRNIPNRVLDSSAPIDYCPHCLNCGGVGNVRKGGPWKMFSPFDYERKGITMCGDAVGNNDHMRSGSFANPPSMPYAAKFKPGSIANLEYDVTAHHNGFLSFFLCDASKTGDIGSSVEYFKNNCFELERSPHPSCESGNDKECGPIDPKYPGRWVLPCKNGAPDQIFGGSNGKMAYKIPDQEMKDAVIMAYWLTQNTCSTPDGFMQKYNYPSAWAGCPGDGGTLGAKPTFKDCATTGQTPEEFFNCADVQIVGGGSANGDPGPRRQSPVATDDNTGAKPTADTNKKAGEATVDKTKSPTVDKKEDGGDDYAAFSPSHSSPKAHSSPKDCASKPEVVDPTEIVADDAQCAGHFKQCGGKGYGGPTTCCDKRYTCVALAPYYHQCLSSSPMGGGHATHGGHEKRQY